MELDREAKGGCEDWTRLDLTGESNLTESLKQKQKMSV